MVALFDYDPWESSPNMDSEVRHMSHIMFDLKSSIVSNTVNWFEVIFQDSFRLSKVELGFRSGDIIYVIGEMDQDGFYYVSVNASVVR